MSKLCSSYFSSSGSWVAPAGVTYVYLLGHGGGSGGGGARSSATSGNSAWGGQSTVPVLLRVAVTPNTSYTITIGTGGAGGPGGPTGTPYTPPGAGNDTTFGTATFIGAPIGATAISSNYQQLPTSAMAGQVWYVPQTNYSSFSGYEHGPPRGTASGTFVGGQPGTPGMGSSIPSGAGGNGNNAGVGSNGANANGFGGGGGGGGGGSTSGGAGGSGAPGQLWVIWVE